MRFLAANKLFNGKHFLPASAILVLDAQNSVTEIADTSLIPDDKIEFFDGILTPGFVNSHCHLELSHLKGKIKKHTGIPEFGKQIIGQRMSGFAHEEINEQATDADLEMWQNGIVAVGDISNGEDSFNVKQQSKIFYHTFVEVLGLNPINQLPMFAVGQELLKKLELLNLSASIVPHAPYSTSLALIEQCAAYDRENNLPFCIHNQETEEETKFFLGETNDFKKLYDFLGLDISWFKAPHTSSLAYYIDTIKDQQALLVHNTFSSKADVMSAKNMGCYFCFCPNANLFIENRLPNFNLFKEYANSICIGTDSLASNDSLNLIDECNSILNNTSVFSLEILLQMITHNGAKALNLEQEFGSFIPGKNTGLNLVKFENNQLHLLKKII